MILDHNGNKWYKIGLHIHTTLSDGQVSPEKAAEIYKNAGFDAIALTDHWHYGTSGTLSGLMILSGCEYNLGGNCTEKDVMHIVGFGMKYAPDLDRKTATRKETVEKIHAAGGVAVLAHPAWSLNSPEDALELPGFDAIEIYNTVSAVGQSDRAYSGYFVDLLANRGMTRPLLAVDDTHYYNGDDETKSFIMARMETLTEENILNAVRSGSFYATQTPELYTALEDGVFKVRCSPCCKISVFSNLAWTCDRLARGENLCYLEYRPKDGERYLRAEVTDNNGKMAWSNIYSLA